jgi:hypothetical protein
VDVGDLQRDQRDCNDIEIINRNATRLNREATDTLEYQRLAWDERTKVVQTALSKPASSRARLS